ncbi:MAG: hypothetical protein ACK460_22820 [Microcystis sp.]|uniref:hypothetical protein n=1 Tax=Microcystis sp. TaxID=1127 RepID=UPI003918BC47
MPLASHSIRIKSPGGVLDVLLAIQQTLSSKGFQLLSHTSATPPHPERVGKSPAELMMGQEHPHWLELLGFERFQRA